MLSNHDIANSMTTFLDEELPDPPAFAPGIRRAPDRGFRLSRQQTEIALHNALRYLPEGKCLAGRAMQLMIDNNLDFEVALYPYELVTYGETGSVCQNWMQYR
jgi:urocanate hydratase